MNTFAPVPSAAPAQLFDLTQRKHDGAWVVWVRKSPIELGLVDRRDIEGARMSTFHDDEWAEYVRQPHISEQCVWVPAGVYKTRPTVDAVLAMLGVKRKPRQQNYIRPNRPARSGSPQQGSPQAAE